MTIRIKNTKTIHVEQRRRRGGHKLRSWSDLIWVAASASDFNSGGNSTRIQTLKRKWGEGIWGPELMNRDNGFGVITMTIH